MERPLEESEDNILANIRTPEKLTNYIKFFTKCINQIIKNGNIKGATNEQTENFINEFIPKLIDTILSTRIDHSQGKPLNDYLEAIIPLFVNFLFDTNKSKLVEKGSEIISKVKSPFYLSTMPYHVIQNNSISPFYDTNLIAFGKTNIIQITINEMKNMTVDDFNIFFNSLKLIHKNRRYFDQRNLNLFVHSTTDFYERIFNSIDESKLRTLNEKDTNESFNDLVQLAPESISDHKSFERIHFNLSLRYVKTSYLNKRYYGLSFIKTELNFGIIDRDLLCSRLESEGLISYVLDNMHDELVTDFCSIFRTMSLRGSVVENQLSRFWNISIHQNPLTIEPYFSGWNLIYTGLPKNLKVSLWGIMVKSDTFPIASLKFIKKASLLGIDDEQKVPLFYVLKDYYQNCTENEVLVVLSDTLSSLVPNNPEFTENLQKECFKLFKEQKQLDLALSLFKASFKNSVDSEKARQSFDLIMSSIKGVENINSIQFLEVVDKVLKRMKGGLDDQEFSSLLELLIRTIKIDSDSVFRFYQNIVLKDTLINNEQNIELFTEICKLELNDLQTQNFIICLFNKINKGNFCTSSITSKSIPKDATQFTGIEDLWNFCFRTNGNKISLYLCQLYGNSKKVSNIKVYIQHCMDNSDHPSALLALCHMIKFIESNFEKSLLGIYENKYIPQFDYYLVKLIGDVNLTIKVPHDISFCAFRDRVSSITGIEKERLTFYEGVNMIQKQSFVLFDSLQLEVRKWNSTIRKIPDVEMKYLPSTILSSEKYQKKLFKLLISNDDRIADPTFEILNELPTNNQEKELLTSESPNWDEIFDISVNKHLVYYRVHAIGHLAENNDNIPNTNIAWIEYFYETGGAKSLFDHVFNNSYNYLDYIKQFSIALEICNLIISKMEDKDKKKTILTKQTINTILQQAIDISKNEDYESLLLLLLSILDKFSEVDSSFILECPSFKTLFRSIIFSSNKLVRVLISSIIKRLNLNDFRKDLFSLLDKTVHLKCKEYFSLILPLVKTYPNQVSLFKKIKKIIYREYFISENDNNVLLTLSFIPPDKYFTWGIFSVANILIQSIDKNLPGMKKLFIFIIDHILFNNLCYFEVNSDFFSFLSFMIKKDPSLLHFVLPKMKRITEISPSIFHDGEIHLSHSLKPKGLINLGATCYMNSSIQQMFNIPEFRNEILNSRNGDEIDWFYHFQFLLAQLLLYPTDCIDPTHFIHTWKWYDNEIVNVHEQMDAGEFIDLLINRASDIVPNCSDCFKGIIYHDIVGTEVDFHSESIEKFIIFPLEVKNHGSLEESLQSFLIPDEFTGDNMYNAEGIGRINANRYHSLMKTPEILIIQLKRFTYSLVNGEREKLNSRFEFPMELDLEPIMTENVNKTQQQQAQKEKEKKKFYQSSLPSLSVIHAKVEEEEEQRKRLEIDRYQSQNMFDLIGVQMHIGDALSGHYFLYANSSSGWYKYDDNYVGKFDPERLKYLAFGGIQPASYGDPRGLKIENNENAYILYYRKRKPKQETQTKSQSPLVQEQEVANSVVSSGDSDSDSEDDDNLSSDENDNVQFDSCFPDINEKLTTELQDDVLKIISSQKITNPQSRDFLLNSVDLSDDPNFQYDYLIELIQNAVHKQIILSILHKIDGLVMNSNESSQKLLKNYDLHKELLIRNDRHEVRQNYSKTIIHAIDCLNDPKLYLEFVENLMNSDQIKNRNEIGLPLRYIIEKYRKDFDSEKWLNTLFNYIEKVKNNESESSKLNVSSILDSIKLLLLSPQTKSETKEKYKSVIFDVKFFDHLFKTKSNSRALFDLLIVFKGDKAIFQNFFDLMKSVWDQISPQSAAIYFTMLVLLNNEEMNDNIEWFFKGIKKKPTEFIESFIQELETSAVDGMAVVFLNHSKLWIKPFLFSLSEKVRQNLNDLFGIIFKENNDDGKNDITTETETETETTTETANTESVVTNRTDAESNYMADNDSTVTTANKTETESTATNINNSNSSKTESEVEFDDENEKGRKKKKHKKRPLSIDLRKSRRMSKETKSKGHINCEDDDMKNLTSLLVKNFSTLTELVIKRNNKKASLCTTCISATKIYPYATFLELFSMTIRKSRASHKVALNSPKEILDALKKLCEVDMIGVDVIKQFMNLLTLIVTNKKEGKEFFYGKLYSQLLAVLSTISFDQSTRLTSINDVSCLISITPTEYVNDFFKSPLFEDSVLNCLNSTTDFSPVFGKYIIDNITDENSQRVVAILWSEQSFRKNVTNAPQYFYVSSEIMKKFPNLAVHFMQSKHAEQTLVAVTKSLLITEDEFSVLGGMQTLAFSSFVSNFYRLNSSSKNKVKFYDAFLSLMVKDFDKIKQITDRFPDMRNKKEVFYSISQLLISVYPINSNYQELVINTISNGVFSSYSADNARSAGELLEFVIFMLDQDKDQKEKAVEILLNAFDSLIKIIKKSKNDDNNNNSDNSFIFVSTEILSSIFLSLLSRSEIEWKTMEKFNVLYVKIFDENKSIKFFTRSTCIALTKFENEEVGKWRLRCRELIPNEVRRIIKLEKKSQFFSNSKYGKDDSLQILKYAFEFAFAITNNDKVPTIHKTSLNEIEISQFLKFCRELPDPSANDLAFLVSKLLQH